MGKHLLGVLISTVSFSILGTASLIVPIARAESTDIYTYNPSADFITKFSKNRNIVEFNYMNPFLSTGTLCLFLILN